MQRKTVEAQHVFVHSPQPHSSLQESSADSSHDCRPASTLQASRRWYDADRAAREWILATEWTSSREASPKRLHHVQEAERSGVWLSKDDKSPKRTSLFHQALQQHGYWLHRTHLCWRRQREQEEDVYCIIHMPRYSLHSSGPGPGSEP